MAPQMEFRVLGPLEVMADGNPIKLDAPKQRAILAVLLIHANEVLSTDRLMDAVWGEDEVGVSTLRYHVSKLRETLQNEIGTDAEEVIATEAPGYVLRVEPDCLDATRFDVLVDEVRQILQTEPEKALRLLDEALDLWRGEPYAEFAYEEFAHLEVERLAEKRRGAVEDRMDALLALGRHTDAVNQLEGLAEAQPQRERLWGQLALALYRCGRQSEAVAALQQIRDELGEVGLELSPSLRELEDRILTQDPSLLIEQAAPGRLRGYVLRGRIGEGAHGVVWRASQPGIGREVAIKAIRPELANQPTFVRRFEAEAQLVAALEHPHIVSLFDFWRDPDGAYLVMPYLRGGSLADRLRAGQFETEAAMQLLEDIGAALTYSHRRGVVHRDVTPQNVLLDDDDNAYVADFGVATLLGEAAAQYVKDTPSAAYLSPELLAGERGSPASDVFSLGALTKAMLDEDAMSSGVAEVVAQAMAVSLEDRFHSIDEFLSALADAIGTVSESLVRGVELRNPYKGLRAFGEADSPDFFGRDVAVSELVDAVARHRLVAVVGPSGCGKSSLVRAGLLADLRRGALPGSERWLITDMYPGTSPGDELAEALLRVAVERPPGLVERLAEGDVGDVLGGLLPRDAELLLVVDQFEELFTLTTDETERRGFLEALARLATDQGSRARVVVTLRADFFDRPLGYAGFGELLRKGMVPITVPSLESLEQAVVGPAESVGLNVEPELERVITKDVVDQPGGLPLLEFALTELFNERVGNELTAVGYHRTGGVLGALGRRAEDLYRACDDTGREAIEQIFLRLVTVEEGAEDTRRRIPVAELRQVGIEPAILERVLDDYGSHRLITFDRDPETRAPTVEVAHEALLTRWDRLRSWIDQRRDDLVLHRRLTAAVREWQDSERRPAYLFSGGRLEHYEHFAEETDLALTGPELGFLKAGRQAEDEMAARRRRRRVGVLAILGSAAVIAAVLAMVAFLAQQRAEDASAEARANEQLAAQRAGALAEQTQVAETNEQLAEEQAGFAEDAASLAERQAMVARARDLGSSAVLAAESNPLLAMNLAVLAVDTLPEGEEPGPALDSALRTAKAADRSAGLYEFDPSMWTLADVSPYGSTVAVVDLQQLVVLGGASMEQELWSYREPGPGALGDVAYSSDGEFVVASVFDERSISYFGSEASDAEGVPDPRLLVFEADSGELVHTHPVGLEGACQASPSWSSDLGLLGLGVEDCNWEGMAFQFIDTTTWEVVYQHPIPPNDLGYVVFAREGTLAAMFSGLNAGPESWLIDTADWSIVRELGYPVGTLSPDGKITAGHRQDDFYVVLEDAATGDLIDRFPTGDGIPVDIRFSPAGDVLAVGTSADSTLLFDVETGDLIDTVESIAVGTIALGEHYLYVAGAGVVSKWDTTGIGLGDLNTVQLGRGFAKNSIWWTSGGTVVADVREFTFPEWALYPVDSSTGDLGKPIPYGFGAWGVTPIVGDRVVMFRARVTDSGEYEYGPLEVLDLPTGDSTVITGCWMERQAALANEPCPDGEPHPAGLLPVAGSRDGTEFMIFDFHETEAGETESFVSIWDSTSLAETARLSLGIEEVSFVYPSALTEDYVVLHRGWSHPIQVLDRATGEQLLEVDASGYLGEHDRAQNRVWVTDEFDTQVSLLDLDTFEFRPVTGHVADHVRGLATSPSGELVAVASSDGFVRVYTDEGDLRHSIPLPNPSDAWWLDEETLAVGTGTGLWTVVTLDPDRLLGIVKDSLRRGFTDAECSLYEIDPCPTLEELKGD